MQTDKDLLYPQDLYERWKHLMPREWLPIEPTRKYTNQELAMGAPADNHADISPYYAKNASSGHGWNIGSFSSGSYTSTPPGKSSGAAQAVVQEALKPPAAATPKSTLAEQEEWLARTISDFESMFGAQPLLIDLLRTRLMTLPGYTYVNPA